MRHPQFLPAILLASSLGITGISPACAHERGYGPHGYGYGAGPVILGTAAGILAGTAIMAARPAPIYVQPGPPAA